tara:strand:+ start:132 stop:374 length:243 start_codon:yes stop_codon:yes gene_type:complete
MKITINKNKQEINFKKHVWSIIEIAKQKAENGIERFYYPIPRNQGIDSSTLISAVEKETEQSVYGGYKCIKDGQIKFSIE